MPTIAGIEGLELIGRGGFAVVYRGRQPAFRRDVAVKVLLRSGLGADDRRRFDRECQAMGALSEHPGIVTLYDAGFTADERPYLVMAYVRDGTLADRLAARGPMGWQEATGLGVRLAGALETAHLAGVLHRDIKPANVLRAEYGEQLSDFGIARIAGGHETRSGLITASVAHAAPEILDGATPTRQADVYALASTLYEALTGRPAFVRDTDEGLLPLIRRVVTDDPPDLREREIPDPVALVIEKAMAKDPADRHATAREFGLALRGAQAVLGIHVTDLVVVRSRDDGPEVAGEPEGAAPDAIGPPGDVTTDVSVPPPDPPAVTPLTETTTREVPPTHGGPPSADVDDDGPGGGAGKAALVAGVLLALIALIVGLIVITGDDRRDPSTEPTIPGTAAPGASTETDATDVATTAATTETTDPTENGSTPVTTVADPPPDPGLRVGIVAPAVDPTHPIHAGVQRAADELGFPFDPGDPQTPQDTSIFDHIANGQNTIVALAPDPYRQGTVDAVLTSAAAHPEVNFIVIGAEVHAPNVASFTFADNDGSYLVGAAAARMSTTGRVGFIGGADDEHVRRYEAGFVAGVRGVDPTVQIDVRYPPGPGQFFDEAAEAERATELYAAGADVVYHAGTTGAGLFDVASATGNWAIGVDVDQAVAVPEVGAAILTSMTRPYDTVVHSALLAAADGALPTGVQLVGVDGGVGFTTTGGHIDAIAPELGALAADITPRNVIVPDGVEARALAPLGPDCPPEGCRIRIVRTEPAGSELLLTLEANWVLDVGGMHAHYFWSPRYTAEQVGTDSAARFGVTVGDWDLDDAYPQYTTRGSVSLAGLGDDTEMICVTAADAGHNVLDPALFSCAGFPSVD